MIQTWSCSSTQTPIVEPRSQWFGSGFGQRGSTSNLGAWRLFRACAEAARSRNRSPMPSETRMAANVTAMKRLRFDVKRSILSPCCPASVYAHRRCSGSGFLDLSEVEDLDLSAVEG